MHLYGKNLKKLISYGLNQTIILAKISQKNALSGTFQSMKTPMIFNADRLGHFSMSFYSGDMLLAMKTQTCLYCWLSKAEKDDMG